MFTVTPRFLANLTLARWQPLVEWSVDGSTWTPAKLIDGSVTADATSQVCWGLDATLYGVPVERFKLSPFGALMRASMGLVYAPGDVEWVPLGAYRVETIEQDTTDEDVAKVKGASFEAALLDDRFYTPRIIAPASARETTESLIRETLPEALVSWQVEDEWMPRIVTEKERWAVLDGDRDATSIARALGARLRTDGRGVFVMAAGATLQDRPVWHAERGKTLVSAGRKLSRDAVRNAVVVTGNADDGSPPVGPGIAEDLSPTSPTFIGRSPLAGGFGRVPRFYSSPLLRTMQACERAAQTQLADYLGLAQQLDLEAAPNYALEVGDVVLADGVGGTQAHLVDKITYSLTAPAVKASTRATSTRLGGDLSSAPDTQEG